MSEYLNKCRESPWKIRYPFMIKTCNKVGAVWHNRGHNHIYINVKIPQKSRTKKSAVLWYKNQCITTSCIYNKKQSEKETNNPIYNTIRKYKIYLEINLTKDTKYFHTITSKHCWMKLKKEKNKWKNMPCLEIRRLNYY